MLPFILAVAGMIGISFFNGLIIQFAMQWFVIPYTSFNGLPYLAYVGITLLIFAFKTKVRDAENPIDDQVVSIIGETLAIIIVLSIIFGVMALIHLGL